MASIRERPRKDGSICYAVLYNIGDRQSSTPFDNKKAADAFKLAVEVQGPERACAMYNINPEPRRHDVKDTLTVADWVRHHIDHLTGVEQKTIDNYEQYLQNDIQPFFGDMPLQQLAREDVARWIKHMQTTPSRATKKLLAPKTLANKHRFLAAALNAAVKADRIPTNPASGARLPRKTGDHDGRGEIRMLSRQEFDQLAAGGLLPYWGPLLEFMVSSGCRWGEVSAVRPGDVDRAAGVVHIQRAWKKSTKGYEIGPPKTKRSKRTINLPPDILSKLDYTHEWLFTNKDGGPLRYKAFKQAWDRAVDRAGLDPRPTPHDLRHTCASWMLGAGVPITVVSRHLGHENIAITVDVYGDVDRASYQVAADVMGRILGVSAPAELDPDKR
jgi:integrase